MSIPYTKKEVEARINYHEEKKMDLLIGGGSQDQLEIHDKQIQRFEKLHTKSLSGDVDITTITK
ncbi:MAG: hypothetical protein ABS939_24215 [Psychrobacillus sp.]